MCLWGPFRCKRRREDWGGRCAHLGPGSNSNTVYVGTRYEPVFLMQQMPTGKKERRRKEKCLFSSSPGPFRASSSPPVQ